MEENARNFIEAFVQEDLAFVTRYAEAIEKIYQATIDFEKSVIIEDYHIPRQDFSRLRSALVGTHAELSVILEPSYCYQFSVSDGVIAAVFPLYAYSREEAEERLKNFYAEADKYLALVDDSMDEFTKAVVLHDAMALDAEYVITKRYENCVEVYSSNYHQMMEKWGRCETYTEVYAFKNGEQVERFNALCVAGEIDECHLNGRELSKEDGQAYLDNLPEGSEIHVWFKDIESNE